ncbi:MAG: helix-turn-helix transcriptional regulator [Candidatus Acidiferrales bacterium]|jgi:cytoskeletal protein RodZ
MSSTSFGEHLKRERELRGVSLDEIAAATRIKTSFLEALENGRWSELPGGAFNRGFVRATARFLGLDEDGMVAEYALETGGESQAKVQVQASGAMPRDYRPALVAGSALLLLLIGGGWFAHHEITVRRQKRAAMAAGTPNATAPASSGLATNAPQPVSPVPNTPSEASASQPPAAPAPIAKPEPAAPEPLELRLETSKTARVQVTGDGKLLFKGKLHSDDPKIFQARDGFEVAASDAGVVKLQLDGRAIPFSGTPGRHGSSISLSRKDLKAPTDSAH